MAEHNQQFENRQEWTRYHTWLNRRGSEVAICFDTRGRPVLTCNDFTRAETDDALPVRWLWPDQIARLAVACNFNAVIAV